MYFIQEEFLKGWGLKKFKNGKSQGVAGSYVKFALCWGYGYFLEPHNNNTCTNYTVLSKGIVLIAF